MTVILDTRDVDPADRETAIRESMGAICLRMSTRCAPPPEPAQIHARIAVWELGGATVMRHHSSAIEVVRTATDVRRADEERLSVSVLTGGAWRYRQHGADVVSESARPRMVLTDLTAPFHYRRDGDGLTNAFLVDVEQLGLPMELIRAGATRPTASPLYDLVLRHVLGVDRGAEELAGTPAARMVSAGTSELVRALLVTAARDATRSTEVYAETLTARIEDHIHRHLADPELGPESIARAHHISVRHLHNLWRDRGVSVGRWILAERLEAARHELAIQTARPRTIAAVARHWGFTDRSHFSRRFRSAYGVTPQEWRRLAG
jgi:AraC-like DNA-binding protein